MQNLLRPTIIALLYSLVTTFAQAQSPRAADDNDRRRPSDAEQAPPKSPDRGSKAPPNGGGEEDALPTQSREVSGSDAEVEPKENPEMPPTGDPAPGAPPSGEAPTGDPAIREASSPSAEGQAQEGEAVQPPLQPPPVEASTDDATGGDNDGGTGGNAHEADTNDPYSGRDQTGTPPRPPPPRPPSQKQEQEQEQEAKLPKGRWHKDYDGRKEPVRADEVLVWIPRAPLYPVHLVLNYGVRWPIVGTMTLAEKHKVFQRVQDFFTFADGKAGIYPIAFYDAGRGFWGGLNFYYNDLGREGHTLKATAGIGTANWIMAQIRDSWTVFENDRGTLTFAATFLRNPNLAFSGLGPDTSIEDQVFFLEEKIEGAIDLEVALEGLNRFSMRADFKSSELGSGRPPSIDDSDFDTSDATGFDDHYSLGGIAIEQELDSRNPEDEFVPGSGVAFKVWGSYHYGPSQTRLSFFRYGLHPRVILDLTGANHVLQLGVHAEAISKVGGEDLPFNELISLGGQKVMLGFLPGRFRGDSALIYQLDYSWPLFSFADCVLFSELGNVFLGFFEGFNHELMALDWGIGLRSTFSRELEVLLAVGFGTNQIKYWEDAFLVDQVRFLVGATHRF